MAPTKATVIEGWLCALPAAGPACQECEVLRRPQIQELWAHNKVAICSEKENTPQTAPYLTSFYNYTKSCCPHLTLTGRAGRLRPTLASASGPGHFASPSSGPPSSCRGVRRHHPSADVRVEGVAPLAIGVWVPNKPAHCTRRRARTGSRWADTQARYCRSGEGARGRRGGVAGNPPLHLPAAIKSLGDAAPLQPSRPRLGGPLAPAPPGATVAAPRGGAAVGPCRVATVHQVPTRGRAVHHSRRPRRKSRGHQRGGPLARARGRCAPGQRARVRRGATRRGGAHSPVPLGHHCPHRRRGQRGPLHRAGNLGGWGGSSADPPRCGGVGVPAGKEVICDGQTSDAVRVLGDAELGGRRRGVDWCTLCQRIGEDSLLQLEGPTFSGNGLRRGWLGQGGWRSLQPGNQWMTRGRKSCSRGSRGPRRKRASRMSQRG